MLRLWVDDERPAPDSTWTHVYSSAAAKAMLRLWRESGPSDRLAEVSLDHDLGGKDNGMIVLEYISTLNFWPRVVTIHTANPPARERMLRAANAEAPDWVEIYIKTW